jgi:phospholipid/cholesterol/gamma-HCH transport system permease protein
MGGATLHRIVGAAALEWTVRVIGTPPGWIGRRAIAIAGQAGRAAIFLGRASVRVGRRPVRAHLYAEHVRFIGSRSVVIVLLTSAFTGMVLALQGYLALSRFGSESRVGALVALSLVRELAPVLAALMVTARAGSAIAATLANMRMTEQIDALEALAIDPLHYLVTPRLWAALIAVPMLTAMFSLFGLLCAYLLGAGALGLDPGVFAGGARAAVEWSDVAHSMWKAIVFAILIVWIAAFRGFHARGGAAGVGRATTRAVVEASVAILMADYVLTALLFQ